jgi:hypothetical protein
MKNENKFQAELIRDLKTRFPGCIVLKNDSSYMQGIPDLTIFYGSRWATLEVKRDQNAQHQPNQDYYVETMNRMSYSAFIFPENKEEVLNELARSFENG